MRMFKKVRRNSLSMSLVLIITFALLISLNPARAEDIDQDFTIGPVSFVPLLIGQSATIRLTAAGAFGFHTVIVASYGNSTSKIAIGGMTDGFGFWTTSLIGTGGRNWFDITTGFWPYTGLGAQVDVNENISFSIGTATYFINDPGAGFPLAYTLKVSP
jgi:hypothetical protein